MANTLTQTDILYFFQEIKDLYKETDRKFQATDRKFQATDKGIKKVTEAIGRLGGRLGEFIEEMVKPAAVRLFQDRGIEVHEVYRGVTAHRDGDQLEIDLLVVNDIDMIAIECKSNLSVEDVNDHLNRLDKVKKLLPKYREMHVMGAVTGMVLPDAVARYAYRKGLFVLAQSGDAMAIRNDTAFKPAIW